MRVLALISMLHEPADHNSGTRQFRGRPVLASTIDRVRQVTAVSDVAVHCWDDQLPSPRETIDTSHRQSRLGGRGSVALASLSTHGLRAAAPRELLRLAAARRWADGWRGGLHATCDFDAGFYSPWALEAADAHTAQAVLVVPASAGLVDPGILADLIARMDERPWLELCFTPAAAGLGGVLIRRDRLAQLAVNRSHPGKLLHYSPDLPQVDPCSSESCVPVSTAVARSTDNFHLDSNRKIERLERATPLRSHADAGTLVAAFATTSAMHALPRDVVLELNTSRLCSPIYWPGRSRTVSRPPLKPSLARQLFAQLAKGDDVRLTLAGVGDPLCHEHLLDIIAAARDAGISAIHVETDLLHEDADRVAALASAGVDVISVALPAMTPSIYAAVMNLDGYRRVLTNLQALIAARGNGGLLVVPTFVKCQQNLAEMDAWYDQWLRAVGSAVIVGPTGCDAAAAADMSPAKRTPCARLANRMTILSDGTIASCEQDVAGEQAIGRVGNETILQLWLKQQTTLRADHAAGLWNKHALCAGCKHWHRR